MYRSSRVCLVLLVCLAASQFAVVVDGLAGEPTYVLHTDELADEQLFLVRRLEILHEVFSSPATDDQAMAAALLATRHELHRIQEYAKTKEMEPRLISLYSDTLELLDQYSKLLIDVGAIDRQFERELTEHSVTKIADDIKDGFKAGGAMAVAGVEPTTATTVLAGMTIRSAYRFHQQRSKLLEDAQLKSERRVHDFQIERSRLVGRIQVQASVLAEKLGWEPAEAGFDETEESRTLLLNALQRNDFDVLLEQLKLRQTHRPRDPFLSHQIAECYVGKYLLVSDEQEDAERLAILKEAMANEIRAAELVPAGRFHDQVRGELLCRAAAIASEAATIKGKTSDLPLKFVNAARTFWPKDPTGEIRTARCVALLRQGDFQSAMEALELNKRLVGETVGYHTDKACLLSAMGRHEEAAAQLAVVVGSGEADVRALRKMPDLAAVRAARKVRFEQLVAPKFKTAVHYGYVWNDFEIENQSPFSLTNAVIKATWQPPDGNKITEVYWADSIGRSEQRTLSWAFHEAENDEANVPVVSAELLCEENRAVEPVKLRTVTGEYEGVATALRGEAMNVSTTSTIRVKLALDQDQKLLASFVGGKSGVNCTVDAIRDASSGLFLTKDKSAAGLIWFSDHVVYGWYGDPDGNDRRIVFWLERAASADNQRK